MSDNLRTDFALSNRYHGPIVNLNPQFVDRIEDCEGYLRAFLNRCPAASAPYGSYQIKGTLEELYARFPAYRDWPSIDRVHKTGDFGEQTITNNIFNPHNVICIKNYNALPCAEGSEIRFSDRHAIRSSYYFGDIVENLARADVAYISLTERFLFDRKLPIAVPVNAIVSIVCNYEGKGICAVDFGKGIEPIQVWESREQIEKILRPAESIETILHPFAISSATPRHVLA